MGHPIRNPRCRVKTPCPGTITEIGLKSVTIPIMSKPQRILAIETSGRSGSAAIAEDTGLIAAEQLPGQMRHAAELIPTIAKLLDDHSWPRDSLTDVFVSIGPGSFTGLRIGVSVARTLARARRRRTRRQTKADLYRRVREKGVRSLLCEAPFGPFR